MPVKEGCLGLSPDTIECMSVEALAWLVLKNYSDSDAWNKGNWMLAAKADAGEGTHLLALVEAFVWLETRGLIVPSPYQSPEDSRVLSRAGKKCLQSGSFQEVIAAEALDLNLHSKLGTKIRSIFLHGDFETAAFAAMKEVEVRVRELSGLPHSLVGVALMRQAFKPAGGPLADQSLDGGERHARADLFAGAIGSFKNPTSHRAVAYDNAQEASEVILLADLLLRILDHVERDQTN